MADQRAEEVQALLHDAVKDAEGAGSGKQLDDNTRPLRSLGISSWIDGGVTHALFKLTTEQRHRLSKLPVGSDARHAYLHSLASNPDILARQAAE